MVEGKADRWGPPISGSGEGGSRVSAGNSAKVRGAGRRGYGPGRLGLGRGGMLGQVREF